MRSAVLINNMQLCKRAFGLTSPHFSMHERQQTASLWPVRCCAKDCMWSKTWIVENSSGAIGLETQNVAGVQTRERTSTDYFFYFFWDLANKNMIGHVLPVSWPLSNNGSSALTSTQLNTFVHPEELSFLSFYF